MNPQDHVLREVVNDLRDIALKFHSADQLRERLRAALGPLLAPDSAIQAISTVTPLGPRDPLVAPCAVADAKYMRGLGDHCGKSLAEDLACVDAAMSLAAAAVLTDAKDAERYRHLRNRMCFSSSLGVLPTMALSSAIPAPHHDVHNDWVAGRFDASVDAAVDADMARTEADDE